MGSQREHGAPHPTSYRTSSGSWVRVLTPPGPPRDTLTN